ncbi:lanthionine synthetase LanC family protein [Nocardia sp. SC052]|uniref:lanthionine synthetase LanC family protein n=1 Tax=Nocardia sichangensis TaxID=3385975 RepID=UPI00399FEF29
MTSGQYRMQLESVIDAIRILDGESFSWFGQRVKSSTTGSHADATQPFPSAVASHLYSHFYVFGTAVPLNFRDRPMGQEPDFAWMESTFTVFAGDRAAREKWTFVGDHEHCVIAESDGTRFLLPRALLERAPVAARRGDEVHVRLPSFLPAPVTGFCVYLGDLTPPAPTVQPQTRLYWNAYADGASAVAGMLTSELNRKSIPFTLKFPNTPDAYTRADSMVLYVPLDRTAQVLRLVAEHYNDIAWALKDAVPAFTMRIADGIGFAEDPGTGESFGQHRCRLLAEALCDDAVRQTRGPVRRLAALVSALELVGVSSDAPYLRFSTSAEVERACALKSLPGFDDSDPGAIIRNIDPLNGTVAMAAQIGSIMAAEALWRGRGCTWIGPRPESYRPGSDGIIRACWSPIGADIYSGTAGVAIFLAQLAQMSGESRFDDLAQGALIHAAEEIDRGMRPMEASFYHGWTGVAFSLLYVGRLLGREELVSRGERMARDRLNQDLVCDGNDWLSGLAGHIAGLLAVAREGLAQTPVDIAHRLGHELVARARKSDGAYVWKNDHDKSGVPLTGLAHGSAGIALALAELSSLTKDDQLREATYAALRYEQRWYSKTHNNWKDLRRVSADIVRGQTGGRYSVAWCHGAPGIALTRILISKLLCDEGLLAEAELAGDATLRSLANFHGDSMDRMVLCHGLSGNLMIARELQRQGLALSANDAGELATSSRHLRSVVRLASSEGVVARWMRQTPSLLTGAAGLGHFLLGDAPDRLSDGFSNMLLTIHGGVGAPDLVNQIEGIG